MTSTIETRLQELGIVLPTASKPVANYVPAVVSGRLVHVSGQIPVWNGERRFTGKLGDTVTIEEGQQAAQLCGLNILAQLLLELGALDRVARCVKLNVFVNSTPGFTDQPQVANGASDLMVAVFGDAGRHARSAVGVTQLPFGLSVEVDAVFEIA